MKLFSFSIYPVFPPSSSSGTAVAPFIPVSRIWDALPTFALPLLAHLQILSTLTLGRVVLPPSYFIYIMLNSQSSLLLSDSLSKFE